jgi:hypothetical protein
MTRATKTSTPAKAVSRKPASDNSQKTAAPAISAAAAFSFLKETKGIIAWSLKDLSKSLHISASEAKHVAAALEMQGYIKPHDADLWITTLAGETVSGAKSPRYTPESIEDALTALRNRIKLINQDSKSPYKIMDAVAFGDFLSNQARVQAADVGIALVPKKSGFAEHSRKEQVAQQQFLKQLRARSPMLNLKPYEEWMTLRNHRGLLKG